MNNLYKADGRSSDIVETNIRNVYNVYIGKSKNTNSYDSPIWIDLCNAKLLHIHGYTLFGITNQGLNLCNIRTYVGSSAIIDLSDRGFMVIDGVDDI